MLFIAGSFIEFFTEPAGHFRGRLIHIRHVKRFAWEGNMTSNVLFIKQAAEGDIDIYHSHEVFGEGIILGINKVKLIAVPDINGNGFSIASSPPHYLFF